MPELFIGTVASLGACGLTLLFVRWEGCTLEDVGASPDRRSVVRLALGFLMGVLLIALHTSVVVAAGHVRWVRAKDASVTELTFTLLAYLTLSCREEVAFHGYPLRRLAPVFGLWSAQLIVALAFAVEHVAGGSTWGQALIGAGAGSLLFGMASIATRGLALPIGLHAAWNVGDWVRGGKGSPGMWKPVVEGGCEHRAQLVSLISYVLLMGSGTLALWWWYSVGEKGK